jgi:hypothetical protein
MKKIDSFTYQIQKDNGSLLFRSNTPCSLILLYASGKGLFTPQYAPKNLFNVKLVRY